MGQALFQDLRDLLDLLRIHVATGQRPSLDACRSLCVALAYMTDKADRLERRAQEADEMEAVARDLDIVASAALSPSLQTALKDRQRLMQAQLDAEDAEAGSQVPRRAGLGHLSAPGGDGKVVTFPVIPRLRAAFSDGGDVA